jgi:V/A-type H+/Na+-transporting ATPase subunit K
MQRPPNAFIRQISADNFQNHILRVPLFALLSGAFGFFILLAVMSLPVHAFSLSETTKLLGSSALAVAPASPYDSLARGIGFGLAALGAGIAVGYAGSAAIAAIAEKPNLFGRALIFVVLGEGIAIYGFVIVFILPTS